MDALGEFVYKRTYARFIEEEGRREEWPETIDRYCSWLFSDSRIPDKVKIRSKERLLSQEVLGSMRAIWSAGRAAELDNAVIYNCAFLTIDDLEAFAECLYLLMCGCGVGFSCEMRHLSKLPEVKRQKNMSTYTHTIEDSRLGWKVALDKGIKSWWNGRDVTYDFSLLRPMGAPLRTMGGRSSGPGVLIQLLAYVRELIMSCQGRRLRPFEAHSLMAEIASIVIVGGTRRSALLSMSDLDDLEMRNCKMGNFHKRLFGANNSAVYLEKPDVLTFLEEFTALAKSGTGERGIVSLYSARKNAPRRRNAERIQGLNPCLAYEAQLLTDEGYRSIGDLCDKEVNIVNWEGNVGKGKVWCSGEKDLVRIKFRRKSIEDIRCTPNHIFMLNDGTRCEAANLASKKLMPFIQIKEAFIKEDFLAGFIQGDGCTSRLESDTHKGMEVRFGHKDLDIAEMFGQGEGRWYSREAYAVAEKFKLDSATLPTRDLPPIENITLDFISGLYSANGSIIKNHRVAIKSTCRKMLDNLQKYLLDKIGIESYITTNKATPVTFANGTYTCKESYDLNIAKFKGVILFARHISFGQKYKREALRELMIKLSPSVSSVRPNGREKVYDFSEPETHWGVINSMISHNCGEVTLVPSQFCNLVECIVKANDTFEDLRSKITTSAWLGVLQSGKDFFPELRSDWHDNAVEERLVGISLSGQMDNPSLLTPEVLKLLKQHAVNVCRKASKTMGYNMPASCTCVKPAGSTSQLVNSSAGIHPRYAPYYIRNVMISAADPLFLMLKDQNVPHFFAKSNGDSSAIIQFPVASPKGAITRHDVTAHDQLEWYLKVASNFTEMNPSATIYISEHEWLSTANWLYDHFDRVNGLTFFPKEEDNQAYEWTPFQEVDEDTYNRARDEFPIIDYTALENYEKVDMGEGSRELSCSSGACLL